MKQHAATNSLERGLAILRLIGGKRGGLTNGEISRELGIPKSTCSYILSRLSREGYVTKQSVTARFRIGLQTLVLAHDALRELGFHAVAEPALYRLSEETGLAAVLAALEGDRCLTIDRVESPEFMKDFAERGRSLWTYYPPRELRSVGAEFPSYATSFGRVLLAYLPRQEMLAMLDRIEIKKLTPYTVTDQKELLEQLAQVREQGYSLVDRQSHEDTRGLAVPLFGSDGMARGAVAVGGSRTMAVFDDQSRLIKLLKEAAGEISKRIARPLRLETDLKPVLVGSTKQRT
ncbi:MAG: IclR family transcriptional regulator [Bryobacteraceae bacterium]